MFRLVIRTSDTPSSYVLFFFSSKTCSFQSKNDRIHDHHQQHHQMIVTSNVGFTAFGKNEQKRKKGNVLELLVDVSLLPTRKPFSPSLATTNMRTTYIYDIISKWTDRQEIYCTFLLHYYYHHHCYYLYMRL